MNSCEQRAILSHELSTSSGYMPMQYMKSPFNTYNINTGIGSIYDDAKKYMCGCENAGPKNFNSTEYSGFGNQSNDSCGKSCNY